MDDRTAAERGDGDSAADARMAGEGVRRCLGGDGLKLPRDGWMLCRGKRIEK